MEIITFAHVKKFFENADRDEFGYYNFGPIFLSTKVHIYNSLREANICMKNKDSGDELIIAKIYFEDNEQVSMIPVDNGVALYDNKITFSINTIINTNAFAYLCKYITVQYASPLEIAIAAMAMDALEENYNNFN